MEVVRLHQRPPKKFTVAARAKHTGDIYRDSHRRYTSFQEAVQDAQKQAMSNGRTHFVYFGQYCLYETHKEEIVRRREKFLKPNMPAAIAQALKATDYVPSVTAAT